MYPNHCVIDRHILLMAQHLLCYYPRESMQTGERSASCDITQLQPCRQRMKINLTYSWEVVHIITVISLTSQLMNGVESWVTIYLSTQIGL